MATRKGSNGETSERRGSGSGVVDAKQLTQHLMEMGLRELKQLPVQLAGEQAEMDAALAALASKEHRAFLKANASARDVGASALIAQNTALQLHSACSALAESLAETSAFVVNEEDKLVQSTLRNNYDLIMDLVAIPNLFDAFVRAGAYEDALDLAAFVSRLNLRYPAVSVVQSVSAQVTASTSLMLAQLVAILRSNAKLPMCIRVIGYLRRMEVYPETELRLVFLQQKDAYFRQLISEIRESDPADHLKKYIEVSRENFFDIITQYRAIFADSSSGSNPYITSPSASSTSLNAAGSTKDTSPAIFYPFTNTIATPSILASYVSQTVTIFLAKLGATLPALTDTQSLNSLLTQTMYYGMSLGRVGVDFRVAVGDLFLHSITRVLSAALREGLAGFHAWSRTAAQPGSLAAGLHVRTASSVLASASAAASPGASPALPPLRTGSFSAATGSSTGGGAVVNPPAALLAYPPLAHVLNVFYTAFNALRVVAPMALRVRLRGEIVRELEGVVAAMGCVGQAVEEAMLVASVVPTAGAASGLGIVGKESPVQKAYGEFCEAARIVQDVLVPAVVEGFEVRLYGVGMVAVVWKGGEEGPVEEDG
ncbi:Dor1-like family-domain-containing protein, partial [Chytriomyces sp. MP71]